MKIGVVGWGVVGKATTETLRDAGHTVLVNDVRDIKPEHNYQITELCGCEAVFICVPTPRKLGGSADLDNVTSVILSLVKENYLGLVIIRSTVPPLTTAAFSATFTKTRFACSPEFLRQNNAYEDSLLPDRIVLGADNKAEYATLAKIFERWTCTKFYCSTVEAELIKHLSNAYLTSRVAFACEVKRICNIYGIDTNYVYAGISSDKRIGRSHLNPDLGPVPRNSPCLPKDIAALISTLALKGYTSQFLKIVEQLGVEQLGK